MFQEDLEHLEDRERLFEGVAGAFGDLEIFVANAAATAFKPLEALTPYHCQRTFDVVVTSFLDAVQRCRVLWLAVPAASWPRAAWAAGMRCHNTRRSESAKWRLKPWCVTLPPSMAQTASRAIRSCRPAFIPILWNSYAGQSTGDFVHGVVQHTPVGRLGSAEDLTLYQKIGFMRGHRIGYVRASSRYQHPARQLEAVVVDLLFTDVTSAKDVQRPQLEQLLAFVCTGDMVVVAGRDRFADKIQPYPLCWPYGAFA